MLLFEMSKKIETDLIAIYNINHKLYKKCVELTNFTIIVLKKIIFGVHITLQY